MSGNSTYLGGSICAWLKGTAMPTPPAATYVALYNGDPGDAGTGGTEVTTTIRAAGRVTETFGAVTGKAMANSTIVDFGNAAGATTLTHFAIFDAASGGNMLGSGPLTGAPISVASGAPVSFAVGSLTWAE